MLTCYLDLFTCRTKELQGDPQVSSRLLKVCTDSLRDFPKLISFLFFFRFPEADGIGNPSQGAGHDTDVEEVPYIMTIENLEKGLSPLKIVEFIHQQLSISCQALVSPSLSSEWYTRGTILLDSRKNVDKLSDFVESPDHIIISSSGRYLV